MKSVSLARTLCALAVIGLLAATSAAQEMPKPAKQLAKFDRLLGEWEGSGTASMGPGAPAGPWTATVTYKKVLGGHFIMDKTIVNMGPPGGPRMEFVGYMGWDHENGRYVYHACGNSGESHSGEFTWVDDDTYVVPRAGWEQGQLGASREIIRLTKTGFEIQIDSAVGAAPFATVVKGSFKKKTLSPAELASKAKVKGEKLASLLDKGTPGMAPVAAKMKTLDRMLGTWRFQGTMVESPGGPKVPIAGDEIFYKVLGGHAVMARVIGDPMPNDFAYEAHALITWNERLKRFDIIHLSNMAESGRSSAWWTTENEWVGTNTVVMGGKPMATRSILKLHKDGSMSMKAEALIADSPPMVNFEGTYKKK